MSANNGHLKCISVLLDSGAEIESKTSIGRTPLHLACMRGHYDVAKLLIDAGADINATDKDFSTPVHYVSEHGFPDLLLFLLDREPHITIKNHAGLTCIDVAGNNEIRKIF
mmetsp:Transcript_26984/g.23872  ORF Transcript_26984/g.23872 Transcript_26984/m.23872 type:complete len:111 (+) Transcript_26984:565-897(+)